MDYDKSNNELDILSAQYASFTSESDGKFAMFKMPVDEAGKIAELTQQSLGDIALPEIYGVGTESPGGTVICLTTGNAPGSPRRAAFLVGVLKNWDLIYSTVKASLETREFGYQIVPTFTNDEHGGRITTGFIAIGPRFVSIDVSPYGIGDTASDAFAALQRQMENEWLIDPSQHDDPEYRQFIYSLEWSYSRANGPDGEVLRVTGSWKKPGTRRAMRAAGNAAGLMVEPSSLEMKQIKIGIIDHLWAGRDNEFFNKGNK